VPLPTARFLRVGRATRIELACGIHVALPEGASEHDSRTVHIKFRPQSLRLVKS
jgi:hypothetical protein